ncbi:unnamed protein product [Owenia fusiformis]|uniref:G-protein coupled receptors family 1 profile domain-containing protein n=1 Tax=Owenia fusiformis TaxID=6347 RepID=A0A8S4N6H4_OWEFU|nr:unnamed protein product [Owenia fusiformis]
MDYSTNGLQFGSRIAQLNVTIDNGSMRNVPTSANAMEIFTANESGLYGTKESPCEAPSIVEISKYVYIYVIPVITIMALICNMLSFIIFVSKSFRCHSFALYLACLAITDTLSIVSNFLREWLGKLSDMIHQDQTFDVYNQSDAACKIINFVSYSSRMISSWMLVAMTTERALVVMFPLKRILICTVSMATKIVIGVIVGGLAVGVYPLVIGKMKESNGELFCSHIEGYEETTFYFSIGYMVVIIIIPFVAISALNTVIICRTFGRTKSLGRLTSNVSRASNASKRGDVKLTIMLITVSTSFAILAVPYTIAWAIYFNDFLNAKAMNLKCNVVVLHSNAIKGITDIIFNLNYCINFWLYAISGTSFRRQLRLLCQCGRSWSFKKLRASRSQNNNCNRDSGDPYGTEVTSTLTRVSRSECDLATHTTSCL